MSVREYIGARYVPEFGRRGETSIAWDNDAPYEPLTIVQYQGNSYTSRQYVPAGLGAPNNNPNYWALTGNYNAQIEAYRHEVQTYSDRISAMEDIVEQVPAVEDALVTETNARIQADNSLQTEINTKISHVGRHATQGSNIVTVGDSTATTSYGNGWPYYLQQYAAPNTLTNISINYGGFTIPASSNNPEELVGFYFIDCINYAATHLNGGITPQEVDYVIIAGQNDRGVAPSVLEPAVINCITRARTVFPNAQVWYFPTCTGSAYLRGTPEQKGYWSNKFQELPRWAAKGGAHSAANSWTWLLPVADQTNRGDDVHSTNEGYQIIAMNMVMCLNGGVEPSWGIINDAAEGYEESASAVHESPVDYWSIRTQASNGNMALTGCATVSGRVNYGTTDSPNWAVPLFNLPHYMRPVGTRYIVVYYYSPDGGGQGVGRAYINTSGEVRLDRLYDNDSTTVQDGVTYRVYFNPFTLPLGMAW